MRRLRILAQQSEFVTMAIQIEEAHAPFFEYLTDHTQNF